MDCDMLSACTTAAAQASPRSFQDRSREARMDFPSSAFATAAPPACQRMFLLRSKEVSVVLIASIFLRMLMLVLLLLR